MNPFVRDNIKPILSGKKIILGITGSIAAFKACDIVRFLKECGAEVKVILSSGAENFVTRTTLETLSEMPVLSGFWDSSKQGVGTFHISTARWADMIVVAPATAHFIAKASIGLADDLLCTEILASTAPLLIAPAMNPVMFRHPSVQENLQKLRSRGVAVLGPASGKMACGETGEGRMLEAEAVVAEAALYFSSFKNSNNDLSPKGTPVIKDSISTELTKHKRVLVSFGPTRSYLDPVRYLTNISSGMMGASLVWAAKLAGYDVTAVHGPCDSSLALPPGVNSIRVETANDMLEACLANWSESQIFISAAAVLDWDIKNRFSQKLKKREGALPSIELKENVDILARITTEKKPNQFVLGFAAETEDWIQNATIKLSKKGCDAIFVNPVGSSQTGFGDLPNGGWWISSQGLGEPLVHEFKNGPKPQLARELFSFLATQADRKNYGTD